METIKDTLINGDSVKEFSKSDEIINDSVTVSEDYTSCKNKINTTDEKKCGQSVPESIVDNVSISLEDVGNNNDIRLESLNCNHTHDDNSVTSEFSDSSPRKTCNLINEINNDLDNCSNKIENEDSGISTVNNDLEDSKCYDSCTDFVGLELALTESNGTEPFLEELCMKMGSIVKSPESIDVPLPSLTKDDSTDNDVSYSDSLTAESDQDGCSSYVDSSCQQLQDITNNFKGEIDRLKWRITELEKEATHLECNDKLTTMEKAVEQLKLELDLSRKEHGLDSRSFAKEKLELEAKVESLKKEYQAANKDREAAVVRYACGEMELMNHKKERELLDKKVKEISKEKDVLVSKLKTLTSDKTRVCQLLDSKCSELTVAQKEIDNMKEELNSRDIKLKWVQNKLRTETDAKMELEAKVESLNSKVQETHQEAEKAKFNAQESIKQFQESEENKAFTLGQQMKEERVKLMLIEHERDEGESTRKQLINDLETCRVKLKASLEENDTLALKVQVLEKERLQYEQNLSQLKHKTDNQSQNISELHHSVKDLEALRIQLQCEQQRVSSSQTEMERLRQSNLELLQDMESCRKREADMLEFTQKLTAKNVRLQSEFTAVEAKVQQLECEEAPLQKRIVELDSKVSSLLKELEKEKLQRTEECKMLAKHVAEKTSRVKGLESQVEDLTNQIQLVKRKDAGTIKELNKELVQLRRRVEHNECGSGSDSLYHGSRTSSCTSLNDSSAHASTPPTNSQTNLQLEPNRQALIERIGRLQQENAKAVEKIDFLEEHTQTLVEELQKKSKVLQSYVLREESGTLSSSLMDMNKAELTKHGGIMASVYGSKAADEHMTLELSLEINRKLQAVLEDTLLKNITLKENIDTLGDEISRLSQKRNHS